MKTVDTSWHDAFITALAASGNIRLACKAAGVSRSTAYVHRDLFPAFGLRWDDALEDAIDSLELIARERAKASSDTLLIFLLKAHRPERYRETINLNSILKHLDLEKLTKEQVERLAAGDDPIRVLFNT